MKKSFKILSAMALMAIATVGSAKESINVKPHPEAPKLTRAGCTPTTATIDLDINNVRARLMNGGDMWWDRGLGNAAYEVPKGDGKIKQNSLFAGSLWVGGKDKSAGGLLKVAAQTYRQTGNDYWSGPLDNNGVIEANTCAAWDRFWKIDRTEILAFRSLWVGKPDTAAAISANLSKVPTVVKEWPAKGNVTAKGSGGVNLNMPNNKEYAKFVDIDGDGIYNWQKGDYPNIDGDQYIWWIFNDKGNVQTNTQGLAMGLEIQASAFAFITNDCLNDATFYNYKLINKSTSTFNETYTATWSDADLGYFKDDYVGCDVERGLGILYNADNFDEGATGYGNKIPMIGIDFFQGPLSPDANDSNKLKPLKMKYFTYFNNSNNPQTGDPNNDQEYYNFMTGRWADGTSFVKTCTGTGTGTPTNYAYPDDFRECSPCNNPPDDRRFVHSAGPFDMLPGVENNITIGAVWVPEVGGNCPSFGKLRICDDKAQLLFDSKFKLPFGPQSPDMAVKAFDGRFVFYLNNPYSSNNFNLAYGNPDSSGKYKEKAPLPDGFQVADSLYKFEGYVVYQLKNDKVSLSQIRKKDGTIDETKARIVMQCDKKNGIKQIYNFEKDPEISEDFFIPKLMASGKDSGIISNFSLTEDAFGSGDNKRLVNYKDYYYAAVAYGYNNYSLFNPAGGQGQATQYLESRTDGRQGPNRIYKVTPTPAYDNVYTDTKVTYGDGIQITRIEGKGNGGKAMELTDETINEILASPDNMSKNPVYKAGAGPITVKITDADSIKPGVYTVSLIKDSVHNPLLGDSSWGAYGPRTKWQITRDYNGVIETILSENNIQRYNEKILAQWGLDNENSKPTTDWGFAIGIQQQGRPGDTIKAATKLINNNIEETAVSGYISSSIKFEDVSKAWLSGLFDGEKSSPFNWIRSGDYVTPTGEATYNGANMNDFTPNQDPTGQFEKIINGTWGPYPLACNYNAPLAKVGIAYNKTTADRSASLLTNLHSVDIVFTSDRTKWTRCSVIEMSDGATSISGTVNGNKLSEGGAWKYNLREHPSLERDPDDNGNPVYSGSDKGHSWFPGYAINIETGERLNILFSEDSEDKLNNGNDMIYNPTSDVLDNINADIKFGGRHNVYISRTRYDAQPGGADYIHNTLKSMAGKDPAQFDEPFQTDKRKVYASMMWVSPTLLARGKKLASWKDGIVPTRVDIKIRVVRPYGVFDPGNPGGLINSGLPVYRFNTAGTTAANLSDANHRYNTDEDALLDRLNIVPNPYYAYSQYENSRLDARVKIINLPQTATIKIYTVDGTLIKTINKADAGSSSVEWDVKNDKGVPVASGMYLVHIKIKTAQGEKEKVLKWFGIMRPLDITNF
jgi:hypothetical protein